MMETLLCGNRTYVMATDVLKAILQGNLQEITRYIDEEGRSKKIHEIRDEFNNSPLHYSKDATITKLLVQSGCNVNCQNSLSETPLHTWCKCFLTVNIIDDLDKVSLVKGNILEHIKVLLDAGACTNIQDNMGYSALHTLFVYGGQFSLALPSDAVKNIAQELLQYGADVNMSDFEGRTPLFHAVCENNIEIVQVLVEAGADCNHSDLMGLTPLNTLVTSTDYDTMEILLNQGVDPAIGDKDGRAPLYTASAIGNYGMVKLILERNGSCVNQSDKNNLTALHVAAAYKRIDIVEELLSHGGFINTKDLLNATPLHYAAYGGTPEIVDLLLQAGADPTMKDNSNCIPEDYALQRHFYHTVRAFGEERLMEALNIPGNTTPGNIDDYITNNLPTDDIFNVILPSSKFNKDPFDTTIIPSQFLMYMNSVSKGDIIQYLHQLHSVPGVGPIQDTKEIVHIKRAVETFVDNWIGTIAKIDNRFEGHMIRSGSVYEGTKIIDPCEFDFMVCLDQFKDHFTAQITENTDFDDVTIIKRQPQSVKSFSELCCGDKLESEQVIKGFVLAARRALALMKYESGDGQLYVENLTEETYLDDTWVNTKTVTCNIRLQWTGLSNKLLAISLDLVPAFALTTWPCIALFDSPLITEDMKARGCHVVSKQGKWRLSFSLAEQEIFRNLSEQERKAYTGAKMIISAAVSTRITIFDDSALTDDNLDDTPSQYTLPPQQEEQKKVRRIKLENGFLLKKFCRLN